MKKDRSITWQKKALTSLDLAGTRAAVVGGTGGLGRAISRTLAARGAQVIVVGQTFRDQGVKGLEFVQADLSLMSEARRVAQVLPAEKLDLVLFTTGIFAAPTRQETAEHLERDMAVSYLSRLVIVRGIAERLGRDRTSASRKARVFVMGFPGTGQAGSLEDLNAEKSYRAMDVHMNTVAGNEALVLDAARRYPEVNFYGLNPGLIRTAIRDNFLGKDSFKSRFTETIIGWMTPTPEQYAERIAPLLAAPELEARSGTMFDKNGDAILPSPQLTDVSRVQAFVAASETLVSRTKVQLH